LDDFLEKLEDQAPAHVDVNGQITPRNRTSSILELPMVKELRDTHEALSEAQRQLLMCCNHKCCLKIRNSLKKKVLQLDEYCRKAHTKKRTAHHYGGSRLDDEVKDDLGKILAKVNQIMCTLERAPTEHVTNMSSPANTPASTTSQLGRTGSIDPFDNLKGRSLQRLPTERVVQLDGGTTSHDVMRWSLTVQPLSGWFHNATFHSEQFEEECYVLLKAANFHSQPQFAVQHDTVHKLATSWSGDAKQPAAIEVDVVATSNIVHLLDVVRVGSVDIVALEEATEMEPEMEEKMMRASLKQRQDAAEALTPCGNIIDSIDEETTEILHGEDVQDGDCEQIEENPVANDGLAERHRSSSVINDNEGQPQENETQPLSPKSGAAIGEPGALQVQEARSGDQK